MSTQHPHDAVRTELRQFGLSLPETQTKSPWPGHLDVAVRDKTFAYINVDGEPLQVSCKLPHSGSFALGLPWVVPTGYGLGKSGWVTATFAAAEVPPLDLLRTWLVESYCAQAPKSLAKRV